MYCHKNYGFKFNFLIYLDIKSLGVEFKNKCILYILNDKR